MDNNLTTSNANEKIVKNKKVILVGLVGNIMEWFDFAVYGFFASIIGTHFFPSNDPSISLIAAFGAFAAGFLVRPLGGLLFGRIGDRFGRERAMKLSIMAMAIPTVMIGLMPTYQTIGIAAPILIVLLRIIQGLSVGGEYTSSLIYLAEHAKPGHRARMAFWGMWGATAGILLGSAIGALVSNILTQEQLISWGWRLPFLFGALVAVTGYIIRQSIHSTNETGASESPIKDTFTKYRWPVIRVALLNVGFGVSFYTAFVYAVTYIKEIDHLTEKVALDLNTLSMILLLVLIPMASWFSDRFGRKALIILGSSILAFGAIPLFHLLHSTDTSLIFLGELGFVVGLALTAGGIVAANVELMPNAIRCTGLAFAYNASIGFFGGTTPMISAWLIKTTGNPIAPAYWVAAASAVTLFTALFLIPETKNISLED
ncbi:MAG: MFS transporter [Gammaproteobacteria bacterium]|nr:MFS transporter [Gammaproteobacteria bacterium]